MCPVQAESPPVQVKEPYGDLDIVTCRLSSSNPECTKYTCGKYSKEGLAVYRERKKVLMLEDYCALYVNIYHMFETLLEVIIQSLHMLLTFSRLPIVICPPV